MKKQRFKPSSILKTDGCKEQHKVAITRRSDDESAGGVGKVLDKWGNRLILAFKLFEYAKPYILELFNHLQQFM